jgi:hypothetical protein
LRDDVAALRLHAGRVERALHVWICSTGPWSIQAQRTGPRESTA